jgi:predicted metalloprotease with PDZ domain
MKPSLLRVHPLVVWMLVVLAVMVADSSQVSAQQSAGGVIQLEVDVSDVQRRIYRVKLKLPAQPGRLSLHYPQWLPGKHSSAGPIEQLSGLRFTGGGREIPWRRDPTDVYRFDLTVPAGVSAVEAEFQVATPQATEAGRLARVTATASLLGLQWNQVVLYPLGATAMNVPVSASVRLPAGWKQASALAVTAQSGDDADRIQFETVPLEILVDSPMFAGRHFSQLDMTPAGSAPVRLNVFGEEAGDLAATPAQIEMHRALVRELIAALGPPRYDRYEWLLALSDSFGGIGLEHHRSSENSQSPAYFREWEDDVGSRDLLAHEMTHSWNGKYRRPARLWTPHYNVPMQDDLLWVYEGMTQYYGMILTARAGLWSVDYTRDELALAVATFDRKRPGRAWRPLEDTTFQPIMTARRPMSWPSWQRSEDYYMESVSLWFDVDTKIREISRGQRSLDDFAREFFAAPATRGWVSTYEFEDVARSLNRVAAFDWAAFLRQRVGSTGQPLLEGYERAGLRLVYQDKPNAATRDLEKAAAVTDLSYSLGMMISRDNLLTDVVWDSPAFKAGLTTNTTLVAVNGRAFSGALLKEAITGAKSGGMPIELIVRNQDRFRTVQIDYREGLQYPHFVAIEGRPDGLAAVLKPRSPAPGATR